MNIEIELISYEGTVKKISKDAIKNSKYLTEELDKEGATNSIVVKEITAKILERVCEYLNHYRDEKIDDKDIEPIPDEGGLKVLFDEWDLKFIQDLELETVFDLINASEILGIEKLHNLTCAKIAEFMKNKSPDEIAKTFTIECHIPEDEYNKLQSEH